MTAQTFCFAQKVSKSFDKTRLLKAIFFITLLGVAWYFHPPVLEMLSLIKDRDALIAYLGDYGKLASLLLLIILFLQVIVAAIPGHVFMVTGGYLFGFWYSYILIHTSTVVASQFAYWLARKYGRPIVEKLAPPQILETWTQRAERQGTVFFIFSFILPVFPSDVMNYVAGLCGLSGRKFLVANFVGRLPTSILFALIGAQGFQISSALVVVAVVITIVMFALWRKLSPAIEKRYLIKEKQ